MTLPEAQGIADRLKTLLSPVCQRIEVAGSIRREKPEGIKDVELVVLPALGGGLWADGSLLSDFLCTSPPELGHCIKGQPEGKYLQYALPEGVNLDLFVQSSETWGLNFMIRTGSASFSHGMAKRWKALGYRSEAARLHHADGTIASLPEEEDVFRLLRVQGVEPKDRLDESRIRFVMTEADR